MHHDPRRAHYTSCWSVSEHSHHMNSVAFEGTIKLVYTLYWEGAPVLQPRILTNPTWNDLWDAAEALIVESGDDHHIFIEDFYYDSDINAYQLSTGS